MEITNLAGSTRRHAGDVRPAAPVLKIRPADEDATLIRAAARSTRDLMDASPRIYWSDFLLSATAGYAGLAGAIALRPVWLELAAGLIAVLALYRAESFIHELTHLKRSAVPGFRTAWNLLVGIPLLMPSFLYEGVHNLHHARTRYGTGEDPEYLPLTRMPPRSIALLMGAALIAPIAILVRFAVLAPLSAVIPPLRRIVVERYSALAINPGFRRKAAEGEARRSWLRQEVTASLWALSWLVAVVSGLIPPRAAFIILLILSCVAVLNQVRTLAAHLWENDGAPMSVTAQYWDSVNIPPPALLPMLWAPVGLRYHALHHLLPGVPYHALGEAHRRLLATGPSYQRANHGSVIGLLTRLISASASQRP